jgi:hypothetical protein
MGENQKRKILDKQNDLIIGLKMADSAIKDE